MLSHVQSARDETLIRQLMDGAGTARLMDKAQARKTLAFSRREDEKLCFTWKKDSIAKRGHIRYNAVTP